MARTQAAGGQIQGGGCHVTLIQPDSAGVILTGATAKPDAADGFSIPICQAESVSLPSSGGGRFRGDYHERPPPTDLVITLRHLTI
jgi:hypothetical protein